MQTVNCSCGHRPGPPCQHHNTQPWLDTHLHRQLPTPHVLIPFPIPEERRDFIRSPQNGCDDALVTASSDALKRLAHDERVIGPTLPGFTGILPPWGRQLQSPPPSHDLGPGGGLSQDRSTWLPSRADVSGPGNALSPMDRKKFTDEMETAGLLDQIDPKGWEIDWNVKSHAVGNGSASLTSLAPSVFHVAISTSRIVSVQNQAVTVKSRPTGNSRSRTMSLDVLEFIRRFLPHGLPSGVMNVRPVGVMNSRCAVKPDASCQMIQQQRGAPLTHPDEHADSPVGVCCPNCGGVLIVMPRIWPVLWETRSSARKTSLWLPPDPPIIGGRDPCGLNMADAPDRVPEPLRT